MCTALGKDVKLLGLWDHILTETRYESVKEVQWGDRPRTLSVGEAAIDLHCVPHRFSREIVENQERLMYLQDAGWIEVEQFGDTNLFFVKVKGWHDHQGRTQNTNETATEQSANNNQSKRDVDKKQNQALMNKVYKEIRDNERQEQEKGFANNPSRQTSKEKALKDLLIFEQVNWIKMGLVLKDLSPPSRQALKHLGESLDRLYKGDDYSVAVMKIKAVFVEAGAKYHKDLEEFEESYDYTGEYDGGELNTYFLPSINSIFGSSNYLHKLSILVAKASAEERLRA